MIMKFLSANVLPILAGLVALSFIALGVYARHEHNRAEGWHEAHIAQKAATDAAQHSARAWALSAKAQQEAKDARRKEIADESYSHSLASDRARADAYAAANRVRCPAKVNSGGSGRADLPEAGALAPLDNRSGGTSIVDDTLIAVGRHDYNLCTANSRRIFNAHDWGLSG